MKQKRIKLIKVKVPEVFRCFFCEENVNRETVQASTARAQCEGKRRNAASASLGDGNISGEEAAEGARLFPEDPSVSQGTTGDQCLHLLGGCCTSDEELQQKERGRFRKTRQSARATRGIGVRIPMRAAPTEELQLKERTRTLKNGQAVRTTVKAA